jgi:oxalate---CoA ligase
VKVRRAGVGTHLVIHKFFYQRNELWQRIRTEEDEAEAQAAQNPPPHEPLILVDPLPEDTRIQFEPMDSRHLSSLPLVRARVVKLLRSSKNCMHASNNMLITLVGYICFV